MNVLFVFQNVSIQNLSPFINFLFKYKNLLIFERLCAIIITEKFFLCYSINIRRFLAMEITDVKIRKIMSEGRLRAVVSVTIDDMFAVHDIKVVQGDERLFVAMPSRKDENGIFRDIVHPISASARKIFEDSILDAYNKQLAMIEAENESDTESDTTEE